MGKDGQNGGRDDLPQPIDGDRCDSFPAWARNEHESEAHYKVNSELGLSWEEADLRRTIYGPNELGRNEGQPIWRLVLVQFSDTLVRILLVAAVVCTVLASYDGDEGVEIQMTAFVEPLVVLLILFVNAIDGGWEENNAEEVVESLKEIQSATAIAKLDGSSVPNLPARDLVELRVGDTVPADMRILQLKRSTVRIEQRSLTGESEAVNKTRHGVDEDTDTQDKECLLFAGSTVINGRCVCLVTRTGMNMEIGKVHSQIQAASQSEEDSPLKRKLNEFGEALTAIIGVICALVWLTNTKYFFSWEYVNGWPANLKSSFEKCSCYFEIAVAVIPEGLPAVVTTYLALGMRKMAPKNALLRKLPSVETSECTTVICSDESGTLTKNQNSLAKLMGTGHVPGSRRTFKVEGTTYDPSDGGIQAWSNDEIDANLQMIAKAAALCNDAGIVNTGDQFSANGIPTEAALKVLAEKMGLPPGVNKVTSFRTRLDSAEVILGCCKWWCLEYCRTATLEIHRKWKSMGVVVKSRLGKNSLSMKDHPRPLVHEVIEDCRVADTGVMIVIGDNKHKCEAMSRDNGFSIPNKDITTMDLTGKEFIDYPYLKRLNVLQQSGALLSSSAEPKNRQEKMRLLKAVGEAISMTSNRVNVAPILKMVKGIMVVYFLLFAGAVHSVVGFTPVDNYLIDCGSTTNTTVDGRVFVGDNSGSQFSISTGDNILGSTTSSPAGSVSGTSLYRTARIFTSVSSYTFPIKSQGRQWIRLYFFPFSYQKYDLTTASFKVQTPDNVLINFQSPVPSAAIVKEFSVIVNSSSLVLSFTPSNNTIAFVNAIEVVNVPAALISDSVMVLPSSLSTTQTMSKEALETIFRVNMGGPLVTPLNDTLQRTWVNDENFLLLKSAALSISRSQVLTYRDGGATPDTAPDVVYRTAQMMSPLSGTSSKLFNITWMFPLDSGSIYLVRTHFCDIASKAQGELLFNAYIGGFVAAKDLDLYQKTQALASPYYLDFVVRATGNLSVSVGPLSVTGIAQNATLNGLEIMKFDLPSANPSTKKTLKIGKIVGSVLGGILAIILCTVVACMLRRKSDQGDTHSKTWIPLLTTTNTAGHTHTMGSSGTTTLSSGNQTIVGFRFSFAELQEATKNFDEECVVGVGGFGKVYKGKLQDGTELAVKRANPGSQQGLKEFLTEIDMLSKFRHRHLVSLMGFCDEHSEMILVYEYMANGTLKSHLYGSDLPNLSWKQRLEICIGAARGLHYLHTGSAQGIIHRDVKSANILLDENMMAKVSDFGLSKTGPDLDQTHVSTAVKGSFGYLDPEYFRRQQLTEKSDVYSFGVVLLEVLCARPVIDPTLPREKVNIADWAMKWQRRGQLAQVIDPRLAGTIKPASLRKFGETIEKCLAEYGSDRPSMGDVLWNLEYALQLQETSAHADPDDNSANRIIDTPVQISQSDIYASQMANKDGTSSGDDISGISASNVFSQLMNTQGR